MYTFINCPHPLSRTTIAICLALCAVNRGYAAESIEFDETFLMGDGKSSIDISRYADGNPTPPGYTMSAFLLMIKSQLIWKFRLLMSEKMMLKPVSAKKSCAVAY